MFSRPLVVFCDCSPSRQMHRLLVATSSHEPRSPLALPKCPFLRTYSVSFPLWLDAAHTASWKMFSQSLPFQWVARHILLSEVPAGPEARAGKNGNVTGQAPHGLSDRLHGSRSWGGTGDTCTDIQDDSWSGSSLGCLPPGTASLSQRGLAEEEQTVSPEGVLT